MSASLAPRNDDSVLATALASDPRSALGRPHHRLPRLGILALTIGVFGTVLSALGSWIPSLWGDEAASVMSAQRPLSSLFHMLRYVDAVHGSYYVFLHFWIQAFGASPFSVRLPPAIAVGFMVAGVVWLVAELGTVRLAVVAGLICCIVPRTTYMGEETRAFAFSAAYAVWATYVLVRLMRDRTTSRRGWVLYGVLMTFGSYSFLYFVLFVVVHGIVLLDARASKSLIKRWAIASAATVLALSPLIVLASLEQNQISYLESETTIDFTSLTVGLWFTSTWFAVVAWALIVMALAAFAWRWRRGLRDRVSLTAIAVLWLVVPAGILIVTSLVKPDFTARYMSYCAPAAAILMAIGIETVARAGLFRVLGITLVTAAVAAPVYLSQRTPYAKNGSDWAEISHTIGEHAHRGDAIVFDDGTKVSRRPRLALHTYPAGFTGLKDVTLKTPYQQSNTWYDRTYTVPQAESLGRFQGVTTVWLVEYASGAVADTYGLADLEKAGFAVKATYKTHSSHILRLVLGSPL